MSKVVLYKEEFEKIKKILKDEQGKLDLAAKASNCCIAMVQKSILKQITEVMKNVDVSERKSALDKRIVDYKIYLQCYEQELEKGKNIEQCQNLTNNTFVILKKAVEKEKRFSEINQQAEKKIAKLLNQKGYKPVLMVFQNGLRVLIDID
ncbi:MAG: hypothetical protein WC697_01485 [Patescibacteria group bacterium]|jgi:hypothetical protein